MQKTLPYSQFKYVNMYTKIVCRQGRFFNLLAEESRTCEVCLMSWKVEVHLHVHVRSYWIQCTLMHSEQTFSAVTMEIWLICICFSRTDTLKTLTNLLENVNLILQYITNPTVGETVLPMLLDEKWGGPSLPTKKSGGEGCVALVPPARYARACKNWIV